MCVCMYVICVCLLYSVPLHSHTYIHTHRYLRRSSIPDLAIPPTKADIVGVASSSRNRQTSKEPVNTPSEQLQRSVDAKDKDGRRYYQEGLKCLQLCQYRKSLPFFLKSESLEYPASYLKLYILYWYGRGMSVDMVRAKSYAEKVKKHVSWFVHEASTGTADAQYNMGFCYKKGFGVVKDTKEAVRLLHLSSNQGYSDAQFDLGNCYYNGFGVVEDKKEAVRLYRLASNQGSLPALNNLAYSYATGNGVREDKKEAVRLYRLGVDQGFSWSRYSLGLCYQLGKGVKKDAKMAARLFRLSAAQGYYFAQTQLNELVYHEQGKLMFLLSYHERLGSDSSITLFFAGSSIYEPALLMYIFDLAGRHV